MATNLAIDNDLLIEAQKIAGFKTKKETVNSALCLSHKSQVASDSR